MAPLPLVPAIRFRFTASAFSWANIFGSVTITAWGRSSLKVFGRRRDGGAPLMRFIHRPPRTLVRLPLTSLGLPLKKGENTEFVHRICKRRSAEPPHCRKCL